jgi:hypothetical protein
MPDLFLLLGLICAILTVVVVILAGVSFQKDQTRSDRSSRSTPAETQPVTEPTTGLNTISSPPSSVSAQSLSTPCDDATPSAGASSEAMTDERRYAAKLYLRERPDGRVGVPTLRGILRIVHDGVSRELRLGSDVPYSTSLQALPKPDATQLVTSPADTKAVLLLQDAGQEIDLAQCKGALALLVIEGTPLPAFLRETPATLYWFDAGQCTEIVEYPSASLATNAAEIRSGSRDYLYGRQQREARLIQMFWMAAGFIAAALLAFVSLPPALQVISWIVLSIAVLIALLVPLGGFLLELWRRLALKAPEAAAATYLLLAVLGLVAVIAFVPPLFNILLVILLGVAIAKQVHVLWAKETPNNVGVGDGLVVAA